MIEMPPLLFLSMGILGMWQQKRPTWSPRSASVPPLQWRIIVLPYSIELGLGLARILRSVITIELCM